MKDEAIFAVILAASAGLILARRQGAGAASYQVPAGLPIPDQAQAQPRIMNAALAAADAFAAAFGGPAYEQTTGASSTQVDQGVPESIFATLAPALTQIISQGDTSSASGIPSSARRILDLIGHAEAPQGYGQISRTIPASLYPPRPITSMTVAEVIAWQTAIRPQVRSTAAGRYQIIRDTLAGLADQLGVRGALFDQVTQDRLGFALMRGRGWDAYAAGRSSWTDFANALAKEWAALPVVQGANAGRSYYDGDGLNKSLVSVSEVRAVLGGVVAV